MLFQVVREYKDIIQIYYATSINKSLERSVDLSLECGRCITKAEGHYQVLIGTVLAGKCGLPFISLLNSYIMVGIFDI